MTGVGLLLLSAALLALPGRGVRLHVLRRSATAFGIGTYTRTTVSVGAGILAAAVVAVVGGVWLVSTAVIVAATVWKRRRAVGRRRIHTAEVESLVAGLETVVGELGVGAHPAAAAAVAASECSGTVATAFGRASGRARLGGTAHDGLRVTDSPVSAELAVVATAWRISDDHGLALIGLLSAARSDMLARSRFRDRTHASLAGARATGTVLACLPVVGVGLGQAMGASPIAVLLGGGLGGVLLVVGSALVCAGLLWTDAITDRVCR